MERPIVYNETLGMHINVYDWLEVQREQERMTLKYGKPFVIVPITPAWYTTVCATRLDKVRKCTYKVSWPKRDKLMRERKAQWREVNKGLALLGQAPATAFEMTEVWIAPIMRDIEALQVILKGREVDDEAA